MPDIDWVYWMNQTSYLPAFLALTAGVLHFLRARCGRRRYSEAIMGVAWLFFAAAYLSVYALNPSIWRLVMRIASVWFILNYIIFYVGDYRWTQRLRRR